MVNKEELLKKAKKAKIPLRTTMSKSELESLFNKTYPQLGWRLKYIKPHIKDQKELKNVMYMLLSPVRDLEKYQEVQNYSVLQH